MNAESSSIIVDCCILESSNLYHLCLAGLVLKFRIYLARFKYDSELVKIFFRGTL